MTCSCFTGWPLPLPGQIPSSPGALRLFLDAQGFVPVRRTEGYSVYLRHREGGEARVKLDSELRVQSVLEPTTRWLAASLARSPGCTGGIGVPGGGHGTGEGGEGWGAEEVEASGVGCGVRFYVLTERAVDEGERILKRLRNTKVLYRDTEGQLIVGPKFEKAVRYVRCTKETVYRSPNGIFEVVLGEVEEWQGWDQEKQAFDLHCARMEASVEMQNVRSMLAGGVSAFNLFVDLFWEAGLKVWENVW